MTDLEKINTDDLRDKIRGCLIGGAAGDALGYPVEFYSESKIFEKYGENGITSYVTDNATGKALISDDTQMTLFTATGLLIGDTRGKMRGIMAAPFSYVALSYRNWLSTQEMSFEEGQSRIKTVMDGRYSWLMDVPELYARRAPGNTCLDALRSQRRHSEGDNYESYISRPKRQQRVRRRNEGCPYGTHLQESWYTGQTGHGRCRDSRDHSQSFFGIYAGRSVDAYYI